MSDDERAKAKSTKSLWTRTEIEALPALRIRHPLNPQSDVYLTRLAPRAALSRLSLTIARVPPGKESFVYHVHERDEEFVYILSGRGLAEIGEEVIEVEPGDFMGFPAPDGPPHHLTNPFDEDLVYLMGGESSGFDIAHYPRLEKHIIFSPAGIRTFDDAGIARLNFDDWVSRQDHSERNDG